MAYEVLARKWRPQQFDEVVAQEHATNTLKNAVKTGRIANAYLFAGPRGIGKTSLARILAKALNCVKGPTVTPCDTCDSCREISAGTSLDVLEIDGASNTGVDQVRELRENVRYSPARGPYKVYIIDEVHMLSVPAFNALLKTLEEPPPHVKFVFATTEPHKVLSTILSRCQRFDLRRIPMSAIVKHLGKVAEAERIEIEPNAVLAISRGSEGSLRDAECALDQLVSFKGDRIVEEDVLSVFGLVARGVLERLAEAILKGDIPTLVRAVADLDEGGKDMQRVVLDLLDHFRNVLVVLCAGDPVGTLDVTQCQMEVLRRHAAMADMERVLRVTDILLEAENRLRYALSKRTQLETALIRCARAASVVSLDAILCQINELKGRLGAEGLAAEAADEAEDLRDADSPEGPAVAAAVQEEPKLRTPGVAEGRADYGHAKELAKLKTQWREITERVAKISPLTKGVLTDGRPVAVDDACVRIGFDPEFADEMKRIDVSRVRNTIQHVVGEVIGRSAAVEFVVQDLGTDDRAAGKGKAEARPSASASRKSRQDLLREPAVKKVLEVLGGDVTDIRD